MRWSIIALFAASALVALALEVAGITAGLLLGPMAAAMVFAARGGTLTIPPAMTIAAQALIGLVIAPSLNLQLLSGAVREPWPFLIGTMATLIVSLLAGWSLARARVLPGSAALWGAMPGAATAMVLMARDEGADWRLVAAMSYLRVVVVAVAASLLSALVSGHAGSRPPGGSWFPAIQIDGLAQTAIIAGVGSWSGQRLRLPAGALLGPLALGAIGENLDLVHPQLPGWLLAPAYALIGWRIGLGFDPDTIAVLRTTAVKLAASILIVVLACAGCGWVLATFTGHDLLTGYLATSPGGVDTVAIIANAAHVDMPFIMGMQVLRSLATLFAGPMIVRRITKLMGRESEGEPT